LPDQYAGVVIANEVLDAMPADLVAWHASGVFERGVTIGRESGFCWEDRPAPALLAEAAMAVGVAPPYLSEVGRAAQAWVASWGSSLEQGALLLIDYGFPAREYYHPQRSSGTLMCHYRHHAHDDPFFLPGLNDITTHVDFSAIAGAGVDAGLACYGYTSQAQFLLNCGITDILARVSLDDQVRYLPLAASAQKLLNASEMGELFKVLALGRGIETSLIGFTRGDRSQTL
jgi:SAM-dependent MidA family methyltransferase